MKELKIKSITVIIFLVSSVQVKAQQIGNTTVTFTDASRGNRQILSEIYYPATSAGNNTPISPGIFPLIVCGHGFVMVWSAYQNIWTDLVPEGYIVAFPTTESGFAPVHSDFGLDMKFLVTEIQNIGAGTSVPPTSVGNTSAIMGHSMGGGSSFLAAANNTSISTMVSFAAANTNPSSITAAQQVFVPTLLFSGTNDCVAPPVQHQDIMYDSTSAPLKTQVYITGGGHCYFADNNFNCSFGESTCSPAPSITRAQQQSATSDFLKLWFGYFLKGDCVKAQEFQDSLALSSRITYRQSQSIACATGAQEINHTEKAITVFPNPSCETIFIESKQVGIQEITLTDSMKKLIRQERFDGFSPGVTIDISNLSNGVYFIQLNKRYWKLFVKN
jgi:dienelactone hydrolase